jgi:acyl-CoA thioesterase-1
VQCIGDSLALPGHMNSYEDTWYFKLKMEFPNYDFNSFFKRQLTTDVLTTMGGGESGIDKWPKGADCLEAYMPDIAIVQLGIVDCAPRLMNKYDRVFIKIIPDPLSRAYIKLIKLYRKRKTNNTMVSFDQFCKNMNSFMDRTIKTKTSVIIISISLPSPTFLIKNPDVLINVSRYNDFLFQLKNKYNNVSITNALNSVNYNQSIYEDGYHPNQLGHEIIFNQLKDLLR